MFKNKTILVTGGTGSFGRVFTEIFLRLFGKKIKKLWKRFVHWCCKAGLCNLNKCKCKCHCKGRSAAYYSCKDEIVESKKDEVTLPVKSHWTDDPPPYIDPETGNKYGREGEPLSPDHSE